MIYIYIIKTISAPLKTYKYISLGKYLIFNFLMFLQEVTIYIRTGMIYKQKQNKKVYE